jgi:SHS2 domain-containing protein
MRLEAGTLQELFLAALEGMNGLIDPDIRQGAPDGAPEDFPLREFLELRAPDATVLLIDFLSQILTLGHIHRALFTRFDISDLAGPGAADSGADGDCLLRGTARGRPSETRQRDIKAVSYHEAEVRQGEDGRWRTTVVFDI